MKTLIRTSNNINIATFWENYNLNKYEFSPPYQREGDVWTETEKSYLIDTILKNFPMPPIFLHQHIDNASGKTVYDVIDGKQRLSAIISFLKNEIPVPEDFSEDQFGDEILDGLFFSDFDNPILTEWKKSLWKYEITIEYIETDETKVVNHIFDRLNRNGRPLLPQELRRAKWGGSSFYNMISEFSALPVFSKIISNLKINRLEHHEFITELFFLTAENKIIAGDQPSEIDNLYESYALKSDTELQNVKEAFNAITTIFESFNLDFADNNRLYGVSHIYGLWGLAWKLHNEKINIPNIAAKISDFYEKYTLKSTNEDTLTKRYRLTMSAGTKGAQRRRTRIDSLYEIVKNS